MIILIMLLKILNQYIWVRYEVYKASAKTPIMNPVVAVVDVRYVDAFPPCSYSFFLLLFFPLLYKCYLQLLDYELGPTIIAVSLRVSVTGSKALSLKGHRSNGG